MLNMNFYERFTDILIRCFNKITLRSEIHAKNYKILPLQKHIFTYNGSGFCWLKKVKLPSCSINSCLPNRQHFIKANGYYFL